MADDEAAVAEPAGAEEPTSEGGGLGRYTSVVYVHGMGSQRRYEETSRLIDKLDLYLVRQHQKGNPLGLLSRIKAREEPLNPITGSVGTIGYIRTLFSPDPTLKAARAVRFYEVYWAPVMAEKKSAIGILKWIFTQVQRPLRTLRSPWRERQRLRGSSLVGLFDRGRPAPPGAGQGDYTHLKDLYGKFERLDSHRAYPKGTFKEFLAFVRAANARRPDTAERRVALARRWRGVYRGEELRNLFALVTMALTLALLGGGALLGLLALLQTLLQLPAVAAALEAADMPLAADWKTVLAIAGFLAGALGLGRFLTDYMGDVQAWATYEETDEKYVARNKVIEESLKVLTHVLADPRCERVTVVAHSLGTSIAHDALLALIRRNRAFAIRTAMTEPVPIEKIEHFVTMGSPIDKIEYFFESFASHSHRYKRVVADLRGDMSAQPFTDAKKPHIHWINYWDEGDAISGPLHSPASGARFCQHVDNVHVASLHFPAPGASHSAYFGHERVIGDLFQVIFHRSRSFPALRAAKGRPPYDYDAEYLGPGDPLGGRAAWIAMAAAAPWLALAGLASWMLGARTQAWWLWGAVAALGVLLAAGYLVSKSIGQRKPI